MIYIYIYIRTSIHPSIHPCMHACMHAYIHTYIHAYIHIYTYQNKAPQSSRSFRLGAVPKVQVPEFRRFQVVYVS